MDEAIKNVVCSSCVIFDVEMEMLQLCGPLLMTVFLQFSLCLHELQWFMISVDDFLILKNVMPPMVEFHNGVHLFVIIRVRTDDI